MSADKVWREDHARQAAQHEDWAQAAADRYDDGNDRSLGVAQVEGQLAIMHATLVVAEQLARIAERMEDLCKIERSRS